MNTVALAAHIVFILSYALYVREFLMNNSWVLSYPVYFVPAVVYLLLGAAAAGLKKLYKGRIIDRAAELSPALFMFVILAASCVAAKVNFPEPHNFISRKMDIILGASYVLFLAVLAALFIKKCALSKVTQGTDTRATAVFFLIFFFFFYFSMSLWFNYANEPTGDEPAYLLRTHSMVHDWDIDLKNNFDRMDYKAFYHRELVPQQQDIIKDGKIFSYHPVFYSFFIAPFYAAAGRFGASFSTVILAAFFIAMLFGMLVKSGFSEKSAFSAAFVAGFTIPFFEYINITATEIMSSFLVLLSYMLLRDGRKKNLLFSLSLAALAWLHVRNIPIAGSMGIIYLYYNRKDMKAILLFCGVMAGASAMLAGFNYLNYGVVLPSYSAGNAGSLSSNFKLHNLQGTLVMFLDRQLGLLPYAPVYCLIFAGAVFLFKSDRRLFWETAVIFIPYYIVITSWHDWGIGNAGPRYFMPFIYIFPLLLSATLDNIRKKPAVWIYRALCAMSFFMSLIIACVPWFRWDKHPSESWIVELISRYGHLNLKAVLPDYRIEGASPVYLTVFWILALAAVNYYFLRQAGGNKGKKSI